MGVPAMYLVDAGLAVTIAGGALLLLVALWWSWAGDGIEIPRDRWPVVMRLGAAAGWALFVVGIATQVAGHVTQVGVARF